MRLNAWQHVGKLRPGDVKGEAQRRQLISFKKSARVGCSVFIGVGAMIMTTPGHRNAAFGMVSKAGKYEIGELD